MEDRAIGVSVSLYQSQINMIRKFTKKSNRFKSEASVIQQAVDDFFNQGKKTLAKNFMLFMGYPLIIMTTMWYVATSTISVNNILMEQGYYLNELFIQSQIFLIIGFAWLGIFTATTGIFIMILRKK